MKHKIWTISAMALLWGAAHHQGHGSIFSDIGRDIGGVVGSVTSTIKGDVGGVISSVDGQVANATKEIQRSVEKAADAVAQETRGIADQVARQATDVADEVAKTAKTVEIVGAGLVGKGPKGPSKAEIAKEILQALLEPSASMVNSLYCAKTPMVSGSIHEKVDDQWSHHKDDIMRKYNDLLNSPVSQLKERLADFFKEAGENLDVSDSAIQNDAEACHETWKNSCTNIFPHYNALNLAVMTYILKENRKLLNKTQMSTCTFAAEHASKK